MTPTASNPKAEGSGTGRWPWKARAVPQPGGKGALHSTRREFIDVAAVGIRLKQIARAVKGQSMRIIQPGGKGALHSARREFIDVAAACTSATNRLPALLKASPAGLSNPEAKVLRTPPGVNS